MLIASTSLAGLIRSSEMKRRITICDELIMLCDMLSLDIKYKKCTVYETLDKCALSSLSFINSEFVKRERAVISPLSREENEALSRLLFSLGKSDAKSQLSMLESFKEYIKISREKYSNYYSRNSKICISFGVFSGLVTAVILL